MAAGEWEDDDGSSWGSTARGVLQGADDFMRSTGNAVSFGMADRLAGKLEGTGTDAEVARSAAARERSPYLSIAGDIAGSVMVPGFGAARLAARYGGGRLARALGYGVTGAGTGAAQGAGNTYTENPADYIKNAGIGAGIGFVTGAGGGVAFGRGPATPRAQAPTGDELHSVASNTYDVLARYPQMYEQRALANRATDIENNLLAQRYHWRDSPGTWRGIDEARVGGAPGQLNTGPNAIVGPADIDFVRQGLNKIPRTEATATDRESARIVKQGFDDFMENPPPGAVLPGMERTAARAAQTSERARGDWAAHKRVEAIDDMVENATTGTGSANSGLNLQNKMRQAVSSFTRRKSGESAASKAGFDRDEIAALVNYSRGTNPTNLTRWASNVLGGGSGAAMPVAAAAYGGLAGGNTYLRSQDPAASSAASLTAAIAAPVAGLALRRYGNRRADRDLAALRDTMARRSPLFQYRELMNPGTNPGAGSPLAAKTARDAIALEMISKQPAEPESEWK